MKPIRLILLLFLVLVSMFAVHAQKSFIYTKGKNLMLPDGKPFLMKGTNLGNWLVPEGYMFKFRDVNSPRMIDQALNELIGPAAVDSFWKTYLNNYITGADIQFMKAIGMNSIRVPFNYRLFTNEKYLGISNPNHGFELLDRLISWCRKEQLYILLDMHCAPGGQTGDNIDDGHAYPFLFDSEQDQQLTVAIWKRIAYRYRNEPIIIGYDLLNEPIATYFNADQFNYKLEGLYKRITAAIREVDKNHIIFLGGAQWNTNFAPFGQPFDHKLVYTFHKYWMPPIKESIQSYIDFSNKYNVPVYCGETGENTDQWVDSFRITLEKANIGWHFWPYKKMDDTQGIVKFAKPASYDTIINYAATAKKNFADVRKYRPGNLAEIKQALNEFLKFCLFENCKPNSGYIQALGFSENNQANYGKKKHPVNGLTSK
ncbi:glycoside hydrolase family 5 protein [Chitinophagaceae bacterium LB-8]|uniref:Glycoside hydrolase family 5 protein n=1 Tax=Paraflavisolibacter caeni TaxID=2982496 RepID=A0A9X2XNV0_9BACT|nr:cellulase family glycosylhydrolase [Paraflavisolibacter caeni]MCU7549703.1 glycoside hydrolase family 5 protein [Paraflavisolibacter caeni]